MIVQAVVTAVLALVGARIAVPTWRRERLTDGGAAVLVALTRAVMLALLVLAIVAGIGAPLIPGVLSGLAFGFVYAVVGWRSIRHMFRTSSINPRNPR